MTNCSTNPSNPKHVFYLHGRIIEVQGINAVSEQFGKYDYQAIIDSLSIENVIVHHEIRTTETDFYDFGAKISGEIDRLIKNDVKPEQITIVGASKGAVMAMYISHISQHQINYVLLGANNDYLEQEMDWELKGNILGIYEISDAIAGKNYQFWINKSENTAHFKELGIDTGLGHGFLYRPVGEWLEPTREWVNGTFGEF